MRFAHMADCHLGGWRDERLRAIGLESFRFAISRCIDELVDFVIISGDLFNTALPGVDVIKEAVIQLRELRDAGIRVYVIPGSHDYSPSGKTVIDVLEEAQLCVNVFKGKVEDGFLRLKFTEDESGVKLTGILGKRGSLETSYYDNIDLVSLENEQGPKIFLFHSPIEEYKAKGLHMVTAVPLSSFPKGFDYYAGGHVHTVLHREEEDYGVIAYPGPLFPNSFSELEELRGGGFFIVTDGEVLRVDIPIPPIVPIHLRCEGKSVDEVNMQLERIAEEIVVDSAIVLIRLSGTLSSGSTLDLRLVHAIRRLNERGAYVTLRNTRGLTTIEMTQVGAAGMSTKEIEDLVIAEQNSPLPGVLTGTEAHTLRSLLDSLSLEKGEGEMQQDYEQRRVNEARRILRLD